MTNRNYANKKGFEDYEKLVIATLIKNRFIEPKPGLPPVEQAPLLFQLKREDEQMFYLNDDDEVIDFTFEEKVKAFGEDLWCDDQEAVKNYLGLMKDRGEVESFSVTTKWKTYDLKDGLKKARVFEGVHIKVLVKDWKKIYDKASSLGLEYKRPKDFDVNDFSEETLQAGAVISHAFLQSNYKPVSIPFSAFNNAGLKFKQVEEAITLFETTKVIAVKKRPKNLEDKQAYELSMEPIFKEVFESAFMDGVRRKRDIQMLETYWGKIVEIYDVVSSGYVGFEDQQLNHYYTYLAVRIEEILAKEGFQELKKDAPFIYESLLGVYEDLDVAWEHMRPKMLEYLGRLKKIQIKEGIPSFGLRKDEETLLKLTDEAIAEHKKRKAVGNANFEKNLQENAPKIREQIFGSQKASSDKESPPPPTPAQVPNDAYSTRTGKGITRGKKFRLTKGKPGFILFNEVVQKRSISRKRTIQLLNLPDDVVNKTTNNYQINDVVKRIRKTTRLKSEEFENNNGHIVLSYNFQPENRPKTTLK